MTACTRSAVAMVTDGFSSDDIAATARRTGFVTRASKITGPLFLALMPFGPWQAAHTTLAQWAAKAAPLDTPGEVSPEAMQQRMNTQALALLQDMRRQALAKAHPLERVCADGLFPSFANVSRADSTGFALPEALHKPFPGSGGSAAKAGANMQAVWDYQNGVCGHGALPPWNIPDQRYIDTVVALAHTGLLFLLD